MSAVVHHRTVKTGSAVGTEQFAAAMGRRLKGGETIELSSDLGGGKTTFVRGLARGMGSHEKVASPTFTISQEYRAGELTIYHFDFYRLNEPGIMADELAEVVGKPHAVVVIEWGDIVQHVLSPHRLTITIKAVGETERELALTYPESLAYAVPEEY